MTDQLPSTGASRMRKFRDKRKVEDPNFAANEAKRMREFRKQKKEKLSDSELQAIRIKERHKKRLQRAKKRVKIESFDESSVSFELSYMSKQDLSKDLHKTLTDQPASTGAIRSRKFREKRKVEDPNFTANEAKRMREFRKQKKEKLSKSELQAIRIKERDKKRLQRAKKRVKIESFDESSVSIELPYKSKQALSKDVHKALKALPQSPRKKKAVVTELARIMNIAVAESPNISIMYIPSSEINENIESASPWDNTKGVFGI